MPDSDHIEPIPEAMDKQNKTAVRRVRKLIAELKELEDDERCAERDPTEESAQR